MAFDDWEIKRDLRIELLKVSDRVQELSIQSRSLSDGSVTATSLNDLQIKIGEIIGNLWK